MAGVVDTLTSDDNDRDSDSDGDGGHDKMLSGSSGTVVEAVLVVIVIIFPLKLANFYEPALLNNAFFTAWRIGDFLSIRKGNIVKIIKAWAQLTK
ncbi:hypothetical protein DVQ85_15850 [Yersinia enterocolitica]|nr:hypothetical protein [Yersinia enterocolitica]EKN5990222.1 hypothetical protein [Yersinia enterocolitica]